MCNRFSESKVSDTLTLTVKTRQLFKLYRRLTAGLLLIFEMWLSANDFTDIKKLHSNVFHSLRRCGVDFRQRLLFTSPKMNSNSHESMNFNFLKSEVLVAGQYWNRCLRHLYIVRSARFACPGFTRGYIHGTDSNIWISFRYLYLHVFLLQPNFMLPNSEHGFHKKQFYRRLTSKQCFLTGNVVWYYIQILRSGTLALEQWRKNVIIAFTSRFLIIADTDS